MEILSQAVLTVQVMSTHIVMKKADAVAAAAANIILKAIKINGAG
jgi:hypothetical protein